MKKLLAILGLVVLSQPAFAAVTVNAGVYRIDLNLRLYEVCGTITATAKEKIDGLLVDIKTDSGKNEGHYVTTSNTNGKFCQIVRVIGNQLDVSVQTTALSGGSAPSAVIPVL